MPVQQEDIDAVVEEIKALGQNGLIELAARFEQAASSLSEAPDMLVPPDEKKKLTAALKKVAPTLMALAEAADEIEDDMPRSGLTDYLVDVAQGAPDELNKALAL